MVAFFAGIVETYLHFHSPTFIDIYLHREEYPSELRICLKVKYDRCELRFSSYAPWYNRRLHILHSAGLIELKKPSSDRWIKILVDRVAPSSLDTTEKTFSICSKPLTLEEIHRIADEIRDERFDIRWSMTGYGYIPFDDLYYTLRDLARSINKQIKQITLIPSPIVVIKADGIPSKVDYIRFVRNVLAPAELIDRVFIEVLMTPADKEVLNRIKDSEIREALEILFEKQRVLREALEEYRKAVTASDYKDVISKVRGAIENLTHGASIGSKVFQALKKAFAGLDIIGEIRPGSGVRYREINAVILELDRLSSALFRITSKLGVHQPDYIPKPYIHDAEFLLHQALTFINYLIKVLIRYGTRT